MWIIKYFEKIKRMDNLIAKKATGNPQEFSRKMNFSKRSLMGYIRAMRFLGFPIKYDKERGCYFYKEDCERPDILGRRIDKKEQTLINTKLPGKEREKCAEALLENNDKEITVHCSDLFIK